MHTALNELTTILITYESNRITGIDWRQAEPVYEYNY